MRESLQQQVQPRTVSVSVVCAPNGLGRNATSRDDARKWKHETRKQANMPGGTAAGSRGTTQNPCQ